MFELQARLPLKILKKLEDVSHMCTNIIYMSFNTQEVSFLDSFFFFLSFLSHKLAFSFSDICRATAISMEDVCTVCYSMQTGKPAMFPHVPNLMDQESRLRHFLSNLSNFQLNQSLNNNLTMTFNLNLH